MQNSLFFVIFCKLLRNPTRLNGINLHILDCYATNFDVIILDYYL